MPESPAPSPRPFGQESPSRLVATLIRISQAMPHRGPGPHISALIRSLVTRYATMPVDVEAEGIRLRCFFRDNYSEKKFIFTPWRFDATERRHIARHLPDDGVFVDIGANIGIYSLTALKVLGPRGTLVSIEPNPAVYQRLCFNLQANLSDQPGITPTIHTVQAGVSDKNHTLDLHINQSNLGASSLNQRGHSTGHEVEAQESPTQSIPCRPLLEILGELGLNRVSAIKIDIEGAEDRALVPYLQQAPENLLARFILMENSEDAWELPLLAEMEMRGYRRVQTFKMNSLYQRDPDSGRS